MKSLTGIYAAIACFLAVFLLAACATLGQPPEPAKVQAKSASSIC